MAHDFVIQSARPLIALVLFSVSALTASCRARMDVADPEAQVQQAWQSFRLADYKLALHTFDAVIESPDVPTGPRLKALYGLATVWDLRQPVPSQNDELAAQLYEQVIAEAPDSDLAAWSSLALARMTHLVPVDREPAYDAVRAAYQTVIDRFPDRLASHEALIYQQSTLIMTLDPEITRTAIARLLAFVAAYPESPFLSAAWNLIAQGHETLGDAEGQLDARQRELATLEIDPNSPAAADLSWRYWQLAATAEFTAGRFDVAREFYRKLIDEYPMDHRKFAARQALERMDRVERKLLEGGMP